MCSAQAASAGAGGGFSDDGDNDRVMVGWRPVGWGKETEYMASSGRG